MDDGPKNQHYVPRCYLKRFLNSGNELGVFNKVTKKSYFKGLKAVGSENCFYDSDSIGKVTGDKKFIERHLSKIEASFEKVCSGLLDSLNMGKFRVIRRDHRHVLSAFMAYQQLRTPEHTTKIEHLISALEFAIGEIAPDMNPNFEAATRKEIARDMQHNKLLDGELIRKNAEILYRHIWVIEKAFPNEEFYTSDHPIVLHSHLGNKNRPMRGIAAPGIHILFPLSPRFCLNLYDRTHFVELAPIDGLAHTQTDRANMEWANQFQVSDSNQYVFSRSGRFALAESMLSESPDDLSPNRSRIGGQIFGEPL